VGTVNGVGVFGLLGHWENLPVAPKTTKPGWLARLSSRGTGSANLVSTADPGCVRKVWARCV